MTYLIWSVPQIASFDIFLLSFFFWVILCLIFQHRLLLCIHGYTVIVVLTMNAIISYTSCLRLKSSAQVKSKYLIHPSQGHSADSGVAVSHRKLLNMPKGETMQDVFCCLTYLATGASIDKQQPNQTATYYYHASEEWRPLLWYELQPHFTTGVKTREQTKGFVRFVKKKNDNNVL